MEREVTQDQLELIKLLRQMMKEPTVPYDGKKETAIAEADAFTESTGLKTFVIRRGKKYEWVAEAYFDTYKYKGKIYYESEV